MPPLSPHHPTNKELFKSISLGSLGFHDFENSLGKSGRNFVGRFLRCIQMLRDYGRWCGQRGLQGDWSRRQPYRREIEKEHETNMKL